MTIEKLSLKLIWTGEKPRLANTILKEKNKGREVTILTHKNYYKTTTSRHCGIGERVNE